MLHILRLSARECIGSKLVGFSESKNVLYVYIRTAITKYHRVGGLKDINLFSCVHGGWKTKIKVWYLLRPLSLAAGGSLLIVSSCGFSSVHKRPSFFLWPNFFL